MQIWEQKNSVILNLDLEIIETEEGPGYGGAMLAAVACNRFADVKEAADTWVKVVDTVHPDVALVAKYNERYEKFRQIYPALKPVFSIIED